MSEETLPAFLIPPCYLLSTSFCWLLPKAHRQYPPDPSPHVTDETLDGLWTSSSESQRKRRGPRMTQIGGCATQAWACGAGLSVPEALDPHAPQLDSRLPPSAVLADSQRRCCPVPLDDRRGSGHRPNNKGHPWGSELSKKTTKKKADDDFFFNAKAGSRKRASACCPMTCKWGSVLLALRKRARSVCNCPAHSMPVRGWPFIPTDGSPAFWRLRRSQSQESRPQFPRGWRPSSPLRQFPGTCLRCLWRKAFLLQLREQQKPKLVGQWGLPCLLLTPRARRPLNHRRPDPGRQDGGLRGSRWERPQKGRGGTGRWVWDRPRSPRPRVAALRLGGLPRRREQPLSPARRPSFPSAASWGKWVLGAGESSWLFPRWKVVPRERDQAFFFFSFWECWCCYCQVNALLTHPALSMRSVSFNIDLFDSLGS